MTFSAHKFYGPKGIGFLYRRKGAPLRPLVIGGGQESNIRAGTENISGIAGLGVAAKLAYQNLNSRIDHLFQLEKYFKNNKNHIIKLKDKIIRMETDKISALLMR